MAGTPSTLAYLAAARRRGSRMTVGKPSDCHCEICSHRPLPTTENTENP